MAMEVILKASEQYAGPTNIEDGCQMHPLKAFMDDTTIMCSTEEDTRRMLHRMGDLMAWCRMSFKPKKSRSLSLRKGKVDKTIEFQVASQNIPTVTQEPVKSLGRWYDASLKDTKRGAETQETSSDGLHNRQQWSTRQIQTLVPPAHAYPEVVMASACVRNPNIHS